MPGKVQIIAVVFYLSFVFLCGIGLGASVAHCVPIRIMDANNLQASESVLRMRGYLVKTSDGVVCGEEREIKKGNATMFIRGYTTLNCWVVFMVQTKAHKIILLRVFPANPPERKLKCLF